MPCICRCVCVGTSFWFYDFCFNDASDSNVRQQQQQQQASFNEKSKQAAGPDINGLFTHSLIHTHTHVCIHICACVLWNTLIITLNAWLSLSLSLWDSAPNPDSVSHYEAHFVSSSPQATNYQNCLTVCVYSGHNVLVLYYVQHMHKSTYWERPTNGAGEWESGRAEMRAPPLTVAPVCPSPTRSWVTWA